jgi:hypothetical protein
LPAVRDQAKIKRKSKTGEPDEEAGEKQPEPSEYARRSSSYMSAFGNEEDVPGAASLKRLSKVAAGGNAAATEDALEKAEAAIRRGTAHEMAQLNASDRRRSSAVVPQGVKDEARRMSTASAAGQALSNRTDDLNFTGRRTSQLDSSGGKRASMTGSGSLNNDADLGASLAIKTKIFTGTGELSTTGSGAGASPNRRPSSNTGELGQTDRRSSTARKSSVAGDEALSSSTRKNSTASRSSDAGGLDENIIATARKKSTVAPSPPKAGLKSGYKQTHVYGAM